MPLFVNSCNYYVISISVNIYVHYMIDRYIYIYVYMYISLSFCVRDSMYKYIHILIRFTRIDVVMLIDRLIIIISIICI